MPADLLWETEEGRVTHGLCPPLPQVPITALCTHSANIYRAPTLASHTVVDTGPVLEELMSRMGR